MVKSGLKFSELLEGSGDIYNFLLVIVSATLCLYFPFTIFLFIRNYTKHNFKCGGDPMLTEIVFKNLDTDSEETIVLAFNFL